MTNQLQARGNKLCLLFSRKPNKSSYHGNLHGCSARAQPSEFFNDYVDGHFVKFVLHKLNLSLPISYYYYYYYYMAELVQGEKKHSDWFPERSEFCYTDR